MRSRQDSSQPGKKPAQLLPISSNEGGLLSQRLKMARAGGRAGRGYCAFDLGAAERGP